MQRTAQRLIPALSLALLTALPVSGLAARPTLAASPSPYAQPTVTSPVFQNSTYSSSPVPTQFTDALQRAEYYRQEASSWHTMLAPSVKTARVMKVPYGSYYYALNSDGSCCFFVLINRS